MRSSRLAAGAALIAIASLVAACGEETGEPAATDPTPPSGGEEPNGSELDGDWVLAAGELDGAPIELVDGRLVTLVIDGEEVSGRAACNGYGGGVSVDDASGSFTVSELSWTEMGCEPDVMELEQAYLAALQAIDSYELADDLVLSGDGASLRFGRAEPTPDADLVGPTWVLDTVIEDGAASNSPAMSGATLTFTADGSLTGGTGCRPLSGEWTSEAGAIEIVNATYVDEPGAETCIDEAVPVARAVTAVLDAEPTLTIDGDRLTVAAPDGRALSYRAEPSGG